MQTEAMKVDVKILDQHENKLDQMVSYDFEVTTPENKWFMTKRFDEFEYLHKCLEDIYHGLPKFPQESIFDMIMSHFTDERENKQGALQKYLKGLASRKDILTSKFLVEFFQFSKNSPQLVPERPKQIGEFTIDVASNFPTKGVKDFYFDPVSQVFILITSDTNPVSRIGSYLFNTTMPWEQGRQMASDYVGFVECWKPKKGSQFEYERAWIKIYSCQTTAMEFSKEKQRLFVGLDNGQIDQISVSVTEQYSRFKSLRTMNIHNDSVTGIYFDESAEVIYTIGEDGVLNSIQTLNCTKLASLTHDVPLSCILPDKANNRIFVGGDDGIILIYDVANKGYPKSKVRIKTPQSGAIRSMTLDSVQNYLFSAGFKDGFLAVFNVDQKGKQKLTKQIAMLQGKQNPRSVVWIPERQEIVVGMQDGTVCFWDSAAGEPIYQFHAHVQQISKLYYDNQKRILITSAQGQQIKFWQIPQQWKNKKVVQVKEKQVEQEKTNNKTVKLKARKTADNSDDDDSVRKSKKRQHEMIEIDL